MMALVEKKRETTPIVAARAHILIGNPNILFENKKYLGSSRFNTILLVL
jgi:hypothetical protein